VIRGRQHVGTRLHRSIRRRRLWADALAERVVDESVLEAAEEAAGVGDCDQLGLDEQAGWEAWAAPARREVEIRRDEAFDRRRALIDVIRWDRQREIRARVQELGDETRRLGHKD
jgi:hypothetical protein